MERLLTLEDIKIQINSLNPGDLDYQIKLFKLLALKTQLLDNMKKASEEMLLRELAADYKIPLTSPSQIKGALYSIWSNPARFSDCVASEENKKEKVWNQMIINI